MLLAGSATEERTDKKIRKIRKGEGAEHALSPSSSFLIS
jgi:hypothetical protein